MFKKTSEEIPASKAIGRETEEGRMLKDIEHLEKQDHSLAIVTLLMILILLTLGLIPFADTFSYLPIGFLKEIPLLPPLLILLALILQVFIVGLLLRGRRYRHLRRESFIQRMKLQKMVGREEEVSALERIGAEINSLKDLPAILDLLLRESLRVLKGHRASVFLIENKSGILRSEHSVAATAADEQVEQFEEKEIARKTMKQRRPLLLRDPKDFGDFFKHEEKDRKISSLISAPLFIQARPVGAFSIVRINERLKFSDQDLEFFAILGHFASMAIEKSFLAEEVQKGVNFRKSYEKYLDDILNQLQTLTVEERRRIEDHIVSLLPRKGYEEKPAEEGPGSEVPPSLEPPEKTMARELGLDQRKDERVEGMMRVEVGDEFLGFGDDLSSGGLFIRTPNPLELGEQFILKVHLADGKEAMEIPCKVVWTNKYGKESKNLRRGMGVKFQSLSFEDQRRLDDYIRTHRSESESQKKDAR